MIPTLFFDLDGTLIDVKKRHIAVYHTVAKKMSFPLMSDDEYWEQKRNHVLPLGINFQKAFKEESEKAEYLAFDSVVSGIVPFLERIKSTHRLVLLTRRHERNNLRKQLADLTLATYFNAILTPDPETKEDAVRNFGYVEQDSIIGDTEEDIITANNLHIRSIAVSWGLRNKEYLSTYLPGTITDTVQDLYYKITL